MENGTKYDNEAPVLTAVQQALMRTPSDEMEAGLETVSRLLMELLQTSITHPEFTTRMEEGHRLIDKMSEYQSLDAYYRQGLESRGVARNFAPVGEVG